MTEYGIWLPEKKEAIWKEPLKKAKRGDLVLLINDGSKNNKPVPPILLAELTAWSSAIPRMFVSVDPVFLYPSDRIPDCEFSWRRIQCPNANEQERKIISYDPGRVYSGDEEVFRVMARQEGPAMNDTLSFAWLIAAVRKRNGGSLLETVDLST